MENISNYIVDIYNKKLDYDKIFNNLMYEFITDASNLVELSKDLYQIEHNITLNKISLKDYILNSTLCTSLKENNVNDYSIKELKTYMNKYEEQNLGDITSYKIALDLFEKLEIIENIFKEKINYEIEKLASLINNISDVKQIDKKQLEELYNTIISYFKSNYFDTNQIDEKNYNYFVQILNDIICYYLYDSIEIPINN